MRTENGLTLDMAAVEKLLREGDVITIGFTLFPQRLLVDTRFNASDGQWVGLVEPVASVQERYLWLGKHRGSFGPPNGFAFFVWAQTVRYLVESGALAPLRARLTTQAAEELDTVIDEALEMERRAMLDAVRGAEHWPAIWEAERAA
ncbi:MAG TPA: hypothetical protein PJ994_10890 [Tepidiformaceae bacterium]|nr:hypothetical protein [Tepidiformaceae bacterium]